LIHDLMGDYQVAFLAGGIIALLGALMSSRVRVPKAPAPVASPA